MRVRRLVQTVAMIGAVAALVACPLPFQFTPEETTGNVAASNDPANPSLTAPPTVALVERTSGSSFSGANPAVDVNIVLESETRGAAIFYRLDGQPPVPGESGTFRFESSSPIPLVGHNASASIAAIAIGPGMYPSLQTSQMVQVSYDQAVAPSFSIASGNYATDQTVSISGPSGAEIYYTIIDAVGSAPDPQPGVAGTQLYTGPISIAGSGSAISIAAVTVQSERLDSVVARGTWTIGYPTAASPDFTPAPGNYSTNQSVTITTPETGAEIYYTIIDGSGNAPMPDPGVAGTQLYTGPIAISGSGTTRSVAAISVVSGKLNSMPTRGTWSVQWATTATPTITPNGGAVTGSTAITIASTTPNATIHYTTDGSEPVPSGGFPTQSVASPYTFSASTPMTIRAVADSGSTLVSGEASATFSFTVADVDILPTAANHVGVVGVSMTTATDGATIYYTTDGSDPLSTSNPNRIIYAGEFPLTTSATVRAAATRSGYEDSNVTIRSFTIIDGLYDDFSDGVIDTTRWSTSNAFGGRVVESSIFVLSRSNANDTVATNASINVYGYNPNAGSGQTGVGRLTSTAAATQWNFTLVDQIAGEPANGNQGWAIAARDPVTGTSVTVMNHFNDNGTALNYSDVGGEYMIRKVGTFVEVFHFGTLIRRIDAPALSDAFQLYVEANNVVGTGIQEAAVALDNVVYTGP